MVKKLILGINVIVLIVCFSRCGSSQLVTEETSVAPSDNWLVSALDEDKVEFSCYDPVRYPFSLLSSDYVASDLEATLSDNKYPQTAPVWILPNTLHFSKGSPLARPGWTDEYFHRKTSEDGLKFLVERVQPEVYGMYHCAVLAPKESLLNETGIDQFINCSNPQEGSTKCLWFYLKRGLNIYPARPSVGSCFGTGFLYIAVFYVIIGIAALVYKYRYKETVDAFLGGTVELVDTPIEDGGTFSTQKTRNMQEQELTTIGANPAYDANEN